MSGPRFYLVTNDAARCALELWCHLGNLPGSISVIDNPDLMLRIPNGAQVRCYWYGTRATMAAWESWWTIRRLQGGFDWISAEDWERIMAWADVHRKAPSLRLLYGIEPDNDNGGECGRAPSIGVDLRPSPPANDSLDRLPAADAASAPKPTVDPPAQPVKKRVKWS